MRYWWLSGVEYDEAEHCVDHPQGHGNNKACEVTKQKGQVRNSEQCTVRGSVLAKWLLPCTCANAMMEKTVKLVRKERSR